MRKVLNILFLFSSFGYSQISIVPYTNEIYDESIQSKSSLSFYQFDNNSLEFNQVNLDGEGGFNFYSIPSESSDIALNSFSSSSLSVFHYSYNKDINGDISIPYYLFPENELMISQYSFDNSQSHSTIQNNDSDNDGVTDDVDICPETEQGLTVNSEGCALNQLDTDEDGVTDDLDVCPESLSDVIVNVLGCEVFNLPSNNYNIEVISSSCSGENDGSISVYLLDQDLNYNLRVNGESSFNFNVSSGFNKTIDNLSPGQYSLCFTVDGKEGYNQCFDISITEPAPLSASSKVNNDNKTIRFNLSGSEQYLINHNGTDYIFKSSSPEINLVYGLNYIKVRTDKYCQGTYTKEVFISEKVEYYPNPTRDLVNLYLHGQDSSIDLQIVDRDGNVKKILCKKIGLNRKIKVDISSYPEGVYMIQLLSKTIDKTVKIIKE
ncbi:MAG: T9SS type A sorting domain-containing protein [Candidatus Arcticimaribacter sp.]